MLMAAPEGFGGLMAVRTLLGAAESVVTPGFALLTARFYTRQEQPFRFSLWYSCNGLGSCIGGLLGKFELSYLVQRWNTLLARADVILPYVHRIRSRAHQYHRISKLGLDFLAQRSFDYLSGNSFLDRIAQLT